MRHLCVRYNVTAAHGLCSSMPRPCRRPGRGRTRMTFMPEPGPRTGPTDPLIEIYLERRANLVRYFAARTGSLAVAEDLAQELYLKIAGRDPEVTAENP